MPQSGSGSAQSTPPASFVIVHNVSKKHNIGTLARSAAAFGVKQVSRKTMGIMMVVKLMSRRLMSPGCWGLKQDWF